MIKLKVFILYIKILFEGRKIAIVYMIVNTFSDICYNLSLIYIPYIVVGVLTSTASFTTIIFLFVVLFLSVLLKRIVTLKLNSEKELQDQIFIMRITDKMNKIPYYNLEKFDIKRKRESCIYAIQNYGAANDLFTKFIDILSASATSLSFLGLAVHFKSYYIFIIILLSMIYIFINYLLINRKYKYSQKTIDLNYRFSYFQEVLIQKKFQINNKIYHYSDFLLYNFKLLNKEITNHFHKIRVTEANFESVYSVISNLQSAVSYIFPIFRLIRGNILLNEFVLLSTCGIQIANKINSISESIQSLSQSLEYLIPLYEIMSIPEETFDNYSSKFVDFENIKFDSVSFKYPDSEKYVLENIDFTIKKGDKIAIVGLNGSGKTTLIKLLLKLYKPTQGGILFNNKSIYRYDSSYTDNISVVFQDCKVFPISIYENIVANKEDRNIKLLDAACSITSFRNVLSEKNINYYSQCSSEIYDDGVEFSGGEKQLLAITRAYYRDGELFVLDEPSSALDPIMRRELMSKFSEITKNKTSIIITHDLVLASKCNRIIKIDNNSAKEIDFNELKLERQ